MQETRIARLFDHAAGQTVLLPAEFRFEGVEVYATRDARTGDVVLSTSPGVCTWADFFALMDTIDVADDFMGHRPMNTPPRERDLFADNG